MIKPKGAIGGIVFRRVGEEYRGIEEGRREL